MTRPSSERPAVPVPASEPASGLLRTIQDQSAILADWAEAGTFPTSVSVDDARAILMDAAEKLAALAAARGDTA